MHTRVYKIKDCECSHGRHCVCNKILKFIYGSYNVRNYWNYRNFLSPIVILKHQFRVVSDDIYVYNTIYTHTYLRPPPSPRRLFSKGRRRRCINIVKIIIIIIKYIIVMSDDNNNIPYSVLYRRKTLRRWSADHRPSLLGCTLLPI